MEDTKEGKGWMMVPAFGEWDMKNGVLPDYSMDFSKIRQMRKQNKTRGSLGNEDELLQPHAKAVDDNKNNRNSDKYSRKHQEKDGVEGGRPHRPIDDHARHHHSTTGVKRFKSCFQCCIGA